MTPAHPPDAAQSHEQGPSSSQRRAESLPEIALTVELARRAQEGDRTALDQLLLSYKDRLRRLVAIRLGARLRRFLEEEEVFADSLDAARRELDDTDLRTHAGILEWLVSIAEHQLASPIEAPVSRRLSSTRSLRLEGLGTESPETLAARRAQREELERLIDSKVEQLEPREYREVMLLRDYSGGDWEFVRERMGLLSVEAAQELYRRAHTSLQQLVRPYLKRRE